MRVCAWCQTPLDDDAAVDGPVSHGICRYCSRELLSDRRSLRELLDSLDSPTVVVDGQGYVIDGNLRARVASGGRFSGAPVTRGDFLECVHAGSAGGCGAGVYCLSGCVIRRTVAHTQATGESVRGAEAKQPVWRNGTRTVEKMLVSTEKLGDVILLKMELVGDDEAARLDSPGRRE